MENEKSHDQPSANWDSRKLVGQFQFKPQEGLRTIGANGESPSLSPKALLSKSRSKWRCQLKQRERNLPFLHLFCYGQFFISLNDGYLRKFLIYSVTNSNSNLLQIPHRHTSYLVSLSPANLTHKFNHLIPKRSNVSHAHLQARSLPSPLSQEAFKIPL